MYKNDRVTAQDAQVHHMPVTAYLARFIMTLQLAWASRGSPS
uniref:Uncharacterized protein n=1 Tax=Nonomuraea gerenzanensis TaxID=93944 RepID=A0A1M4EJF8_9ACTN|nr:hypothetical protein BN4615_P8486 [Nonomuraea gerenzanensis]